MNYRYAALIVLVTALGTIATRALPFIMFGNSKREIPKAVLYLGRVLPSAVMAALVVYSLKHISFISVSQWVNEIIAVAATAAIHAWRRNTLLSIGIGTVLYMVLTQGNFF